MNFRLFHINLRITTGPFHLIEGLPLIHVIYTYYFTCFPVKKTPGRKTGCKCYLFYLLVTLEHVPARESQLFTSLVTLERVSTRECQLFKPLLTLEPISAHECQLFTLLVKREPISEREYQL